LADAQQRSASIVYAQLGLTIYITYHGHEVPQVLSWDGASDVDADRTMPSWSMEVRSEHGSTASVRRASRFCPAARTGAGVCANCLGSGVQGRPHVGTRMRWINRQMLITAVTDSTHATVIVEETLPGHQSIYAIVTDPTAYLLGMAMSSPELPADRRASLTAVAIGGVEVQLISTNATTVNAGNPFAPSETVAFLTTEVMVGPSGSDTISSVSAINNPTAGVTFWDEEVMNSLQRLSGILLRRSVPRSASAISRSLPNGISAGRRSTRRFDLYVRRRHLS
jgi:hypothetical protein